MFGSTAIEKILAKASERAKVKVDEIVNVNVDVALSHENANLVLKTFQTVGKNNVWDKNKIVIIFDHRVPAESETTAEGQKNVRNFVRAQRIKNFYDINFGICHQVLAEYGHVEPGKVIVGTDSHTTTHGAFGAFATGIGATEMACVWATGKLWLKVPETVK
ncbi:MAG: aconitase family protein, partial [Candidatus Thermoplasmatota archaeon]